MNPYRTLLISLGAATWPLRTGVRVAVAGGKAANRWLRLAPGMAWRRNRGEAESAPDEDAQASADDAVDEGADEGADVSADADAEASADDHSEEDSSAGAEDDPRESGVVDISDTPAPSVGPHTTFEKPPPEERLAGHEQSDIDAMGLDKRREVIGGSYGPSIARQATMYGLFLLVVVAIAFGFKLAVDEFDQPPEQYKDEAPWTNSQRPPDPIQ